MSLIVTDIFSESLILTADGSITILIQRKKNR